MAPKAPPKPAADEEDKDLEIWNSGPPRKALPPPPKADSTSSEDETSDNDSEDSAAVRARQAAKKLRDHNTNLAPVITLPSVDAAFTAVEGPPAYLDPEATRQIAEVSRQDAHQSSTAVEADSKNSWDISRMAPKLKGVDDEEPQAGVISVAAKRFKAGDTGEAVPSVISAAQVAMLGGLPQGEGKDRVNKNPSKAMGVEEFLGKGVCGAQLPRKQQDRKDKEKEKRGKGQSSHSHWKSEAEMALRQQYD